MSDSSEPTLVQCRFCLKETRACSCRERECELAKAMGRAIVIHAMADAYASSLVVGDHVIEDIDGPVIRPFRMRLPSALARRGLVLEEESPGTWVVTRAPWMEPIGPVRTIPARPPHPVECQVCHRSWMGGECDHGVGATVGVRW